MLQALCESPVCVSALAMRPIDLLLASAAGVICAVGLTPVARAFGPVGPSFDCSRAREGLGQVICTDPALSRLDLEFAEAYQALRQQLGPDGYRMMTQQAVDFQAEAIAECRLSPPMDPATSPQAASCVAEKYAAQRFAWIGRMTGEAREEAWRPMERHIALQRQLLVLGFLPAGAKVDGVYGPGTRTAIAAWQRSQNLPETGLIGNAAADRLDPQEVRPDPPQASVPAQPSAAAPPTRAEPGKDSHLGSLARAFLHELVGGLFDDVVSAPEPSAPLRPTVPPASPPVSRSAPPTSIPALPGRQPEVRSWASVPSLAGNYLDDVFGVPEISSTIRNTVGTYYNAIYDEFLSRGGTSRLVDGRYIVATACMRHACGFEETFLALDPQNHAAYAMMAEENSPLRIFPSLANWPSALTRAAGPLVTEIANNNKNVNARCFPRISPNTQQFQTVAGIFEIHSDDGRRVNVFLVGDRSCLDLDNWYATPETIWPATGPAKIVVFAVGDGGNACEAQYIAVDFRYQPLKKSKSFGSCGTGPQVTITDQYIIYYFARTSSQDGPQTVRIPLEP